MPRLTTIGFDADDTLWQNEQFFRLTQERFGDLLADFADPEDLQEKLIAAEIKNLGHYGFGVKGFVLSMIETALEVTDNKVPGEVIAELLAAGRDMLSHPIHLLPHVEEVVGNLAERHTLLVITKGDLLDQERKLAQSGLGELFDGVEIVSDKQTHVYESAFARHGTGPGEAMMVGNSLKSDVIPALKAGAWGVFVPHEMTWVAEQAEKPVGAPRFREIPDLSPLPGLVDDICAG